MTDALDSDFTDLFNTSLSNGEESKFQQWVKKSGRAEDLRDYDLRGAWASGVAKSGGHLPDTFKKPNHPTFSTESKYSGVKGQVGGEWIDEGQGKWKFVASPTNVEFHGKQGLQDYFQQVEQGNTLVLPGEPKP